MQIIINIDDDVYKRSLVYRGQQLTSSSANDLSELITAVANGTPLPKGHGRLIEADELKKIIKENDALTMTGFSVRLCDINNTPTIIEADKSESEG